ncbi:MAG: hypothetical protein NW224_12420 [Leptolyngbyaceae cyanobacterium bins.302]|nr:hypothetical protein [Leptolyngbyaceae cyanobacterium bins.302]
MVLEKAKLTPAASGEGDPIEFMFNPTELAFEETIQTDGSPGVRDEKSGKPKVSFSNIPPHKITVSNIIFDTYEEEGTSRDVFEKCIKPFKTATQFVNGKQRPPIYVFSWGNNRKYLEYCFIERLSYKLSMFLSDGTPVRAVINSLTLVEADSPAALDSQSPSPVVDPVNDNYETRMSQSQGRNRG